MQTLKSSLLPLSIVVLLLLAGYTFIPSSKGGVTVDEAVRVMLVHNPELDPQVSGRSLNKIPASTVLELPDGSMWQIDPKGLAFTHQKWRREVRLAWEFWIANRSFFRAPNLAIVAVDSAFRHVSFYDLKKTGSVSPSAFVRAHVLRQGERIPLSVSEEGISKRTFAFVCVIFSGLVLFLSIALFYSWKMRLSIFHEVDWTLRQSKCSRRKLLRSVQVIAARLNSPAWQMVPEPEPD